MGILWLTSRHRRMVCWYTVLVGLYLQFLAALFVLRTTVGYNIFSWLSDRAADLLGFADEGLAFLTDDTVPTLTWFLITVAPPIIFFAALAQLLSYWYVPGVSREILSEEIRLRSFRTDRVMLLGAHYNGVLGSAPGSSFGPSECPERRLSWQQRRPFSARARALCLSSRSSVSLPSRNCTRSCALALPPSLAAYLSPIRN